MVVVFQETAYGAVVTSAPRLAPSSLNWTPTTPTLSVALAETVTVPATGEPAAGAVTVTDGGVVSAGGRTPTPATLLLPVPVLKRACTAPDWRSNLTILAVPALDAQKVPSPTRSSPPQRLNYPVATYVWIWLLVASRRTIT